jgi:hypothetical protein
MSYSTQTPAVRCLRLEKLLSVVPQAPGAELESWMSGLTYIARRCYYSITRYIHVSVRHSRGGYLYGTVKRP